MRERKNKEKMMNCPTCKGSGKQELTVTEIGVEGRKVSKCEITCVDCKGKGEITKAQYEELEAQKNAWCSCGNPSGDVEYYELEGGYHGYDCKDCGKLLQTG